MGGFGSKNQHDVKILLSHDYDVFGYPSIIHKQSKQKVFVRQLITENYEQAQKLKRDIKLYKQLHSQSINKILDYIPLGSIKLCSEQQFHYILESDMSKNTLKLQFLARKYFKQKFTENQIISIIKSFCSGLNVFENKFKRNFHGLLSLESITIDRKSLQLRLNDPLLSSEEENFSKIFWKRKQNKNKHNDLIHQAPQQFNNKHNSFNESSAQTNNYFVDLYKVGIIILELFRMQVIDDHQKRKILTNQINSVQNLDLRKAINILVNQKPENRLNIFPFLQIQLQQPNCLQRLVCQHGIQLNNLTETPGFNNIQSANAEIKTPANYTHSSSSSFKSIPSFDKNNIIFKKLDSNKKSYFQINHQNNLSNNGTYSNLSTQRTIVNFIVNKPEVNFSNVNVLECAKKNVNFIQTKANQSPNVQLINPEINNFNKIDFVPAHQVSNNNSNQIIHPQNQQYLPYQHTRISGSKQKHSIEQLNPKQSYRQPNKEVEQILKRLGIGSLLYQNQNQQKNKLAQELPQTSISSQQNERQINLQGNTKDQEKNTIQKQNNSNQQTQIKQCTRTPSHYNSKRYKYNSTIVEVGNEDSQENSQQIDHQQLQISQRVYVIEEYYTGSRYQGFKFNGKRNGFGKLYYQDGGYYEGQWTNNKMNGQGKLFYEGGKLAYDGSWKEDEFHGYGKVYNDNPGRLSQGFDYSNFDYLQDNWQFYEGRLSKDTKQGRGKIMLTNGQIFEGDFQNDMIQGYGKFFTLEGVVIEGIWKDSRLIKVISS